MLAGGAGVSAGLLVPKSGAGATDKWVKPALWQIEAEYLRHSRPVRNLAVNVIGAHGQTTLALGQVDGAPVDRVLNDTGLLIWQACDGNHTVPQIAAEVSLNFDVSREKAHTDCLAFLFHLKLFDAILI
jgi:hypothetical protein